MRSIVAGMLCTFCLCRSAELVLGQVTDAPYYGDYQLYSAGYEYMDENNLYNDVYGDSFFEDLTQKAGDCQTDSIGAEIACELKVEGADKLLKPGWTGGLDGIYEVSSCENGLPLYQRKDSKPTEQRVLWYSSQFRDWDVAIGSMPKEDDIVMYGGRGGRESRPNFVGDLWSIANDLLTERKGPEEYALVDVTVTCAESTKIIEEAAQDGGKVVRVPMGQRREEHARAKTSGVSLFSRKEGRRPS